MNGVKSIFASHTFWGLFVALLAFVASSLGFNVTDTDATGIANSATDLVNAALSGDWKAMLTGVAGIVGIAYALYGRIKATKAIK